MRHETTPSTKSLLQPDQTLVTSRDSHPAPSRPGRRLGATLRTDATDRGETLRRDAMGSVHGAPRAALPSPRARPLHRRPTFFAYRSQRGAAPAPHHRSALCALRWARLGSARLERRQSSPTCPVALRVAPRCAAHLLRNDFAPDTHRIRTGFTLDSLGAASHCVLRTLHHAFQLVAPYRAGRGGAGPPRPG